jgi:hypothetical protein
MSTSEGSAQFIGVEQRRSAPLSGLAKLGQGQQSDALLRETKLQGIRNGCFSHNFG